MPTAVHVGRLLLEGDPGDWDLPVFVPLLGHSHVFVTGGAERHRRSAKLAAEHPLAPGRDLPAAQPPVGADRAGRRGERPVLFFAPAGRAMRRSGLRTRR